MSKENEVFPGISNPTEIANRSGEKALRAIQKLTGGKVDGTIHSARSGKTKTSEAHIRTLTDEVLEAIINATKMKEFKVEKIDGEIVNIPELDFVGLMIAKKYWPTNEQMEENEFLLPTLLFYIAFNQADEMIKLGHEKILNESLKFIRKFKVNSDNLYIITQFSLKVTENFLGLQRREVKEKEK